MTRSRCLVASALAAVLIAPLVGAAAGTGSAQQTPLSLGPVVTPGLEGRDPDVAVDRHGTTTVVWGTHWWNGQIRVARRPAGGAWSDPVTIGRGVSPQVATDAWGNVTVVWSRNRPETTTGVMAARRPVAGTWTEPVRLSEDRPAPGYGPQDDEGTFGAHYVDLAVGSGGAALVTWQWGSYDRDVPFRVQAVYRPAGKRWGPSVNLTGPDWSSEPTSAVDDHGNAVVAFGEEAAVLKARRRVVGRGWTAVTTLARKGLSGPESWDLAASGGGAATVVFIRYTSDRSIVYAVRRPAGGAWSKPRRLSPDGVSAWEPAVVTDAGGTATVTWHRRDNRIDAVRRPAGARWGTPVQIAWPSPGAEALTIHANRRGDVFVGWRAGNGIQGAHRPCSGTWTAPFVLTPTPAASSYDYAAAVYEGGDIALVWHPGYEPGPIRYRRVRAP